MDSPDEDPDWEVIWAEEARARREYRLSNAHSQTLEALRSEVLPRLRAGYAGHPLVAGVRSQLRDREPHVLRVMVSLVQPFWGETRTVTIQFQYRSDAICAVARLRGLPRLSEAREAADPDFNPVTWAVQVVRTRCHAAMAALNRKNSHRLVARSQAGEEAAGRSEEESWSDQPTDRHQAHHQPQTDHDS
jgi:hypothetical protein